MTRRADGARLLAVGLVLAALAGCTCQRESSRPASGSVAPTAATSPAVASPGAPAPTPASAPATAPARIVPTRLTQCRADGDCVAVDGDCCGCTAGGAQGVVTRAAQPEFEAARTARCAAAVCVTMMSTHPTCSLAPRCVDGSCRLVPAPPDAGVAARATADLPQ